MKLMTPPTRKAGHLHSEAATAWTHLVPAFAIGRYFVIWGKSICAPWHALILRVGRPIPILRYTQLVIDFHLSSAHGFPPSRRIGAMVSLVDGSKATTPAPGGRTEVLRRMSGARPSPS